MSGGGGEGEVSDDEHSTSETVTTASTTDTTATVSSDGLMQGDQPRPDIVAHPSTLSPAKKSTVRQSEFTVKRERVDLSV